MDNTLHRWPTPPVRLWDAHYCTVLYYVRSCQLEVYTQHRSREVRGYIYPGTYLWGLVHEDVPPPPLYLEFGGPNEGRRASSQPH